MTVDLYLVSKEAEDLIITLKLWKWERWVNFDDDNGDDDVNVYEDIENENNLWRY